MQHEKYWALFHNVLNGEPGPVSGNHKAQPVNWMDYAVGRTDFRLYAWRKPDRQVAASVYIEGQNAKAFFALLRRDKNSIERELGHSLLWREMPTEREITSYLSDVDPDNESDWRRQHKWLAERLNTMHRVFSPRIKKLILDDRGSDHG